MPDFGRIQSKHKATGSETGWQLCLLCPHVLTVASHYFQSSLRLRGSLSHQQGFGQLIPH